MGNSIGISVISYSDDSISRAGIVLLMSVILYQAICRRIAVLTAAETMGFLSWRI